MLLEPFQGRFYNRFVLLIRVIDARAVLNSPVVSLFVDGNRINNGVIPFQKKGQTEFFRVKYYFYRFRMARFPAAYFGEAVEPLAYPASVSLTPGIREKYFSTPQKQPPAR